MRDLNKEITRMRDKREQYQHQYNTQCTVYHDICQSRAECKQISYKWR